MNSIIIGSGEVFDYNNVLSALSGEGKPALVICCDGGAVHAKTLNLTPTIIVGDLDSITDEVYEYYSRLNVKFEKYPREKNASDMEIGLDYAIGQGVTGITFIGAMGDRADHSLCNIGFLFRCLENGIDAKIIDGFNTVFLINKKTVLPAKPGQTVSLIPFTHTAADITTYRLKYPLNNESLCWGTTRGVSNVCIKEGCAVDLKGGILTVIITACS